MTGFRQTKKQIMAGVTDVKSSKIVASNTVQYVDSKGEHIRLHNTTIVSFIKGKTILNSGGWRTPTTKERINRYLTNGRIYQEKSIWYLTYNGASYGFKDGMTIHSNGKVTGYDKNTPKLLKLNKDILKYVKGYVTALFDGKVPEPSGGDCWGCSMVDSKTGKTAMGSDHLIGHIKEKYYVPSLLVRAVETFPVGNIIKGVVGEIWQGKTDQTWLADVAKRQLTSSLRRYMKRQLNLAA